VTLPGFSLSFSSSSPFYSFSTFSTYLSRSSWSVLSSSACLSNISGSSLSSPLYSGLPPTVFALSILSYSISIKLEEDIYGMAVVDAKLSVDTYYDGVPETATGGFWTIEVFFLSGEA
jgi:hypothetical protein